MRGRSRAVVVGWLLGAACGREPRPEDAEPAESPPAAAERAPGSKPAVTPWGIAREREREAIQAQEEAEAEVRRAMAQMEREHAELEQRPTEVEAAAGHSPSGTSGTSGVDPALMSRSEPTPGPMSRPEPVPKPLAAPPMVYTLRSEAPLAHQGPRPKLVQTKVRRNAITDVDVWFRDNGLALPVWERPGSPSFGGPSPGSSGDPLPAEVPAEFEGSRLRTAIRGPGYSIAIHWVRGGVRARSVVVVRDVIGDVLGAIELSSWPRDRLVHWAQVEDGVLYLCTYHMSYASRTGENAFVTAVALGTGELLWQSEPLVCNTQNFLLREGWIISGYGYTSEPDFLFVLDARTGEVVQRRKLASGPEYVLEKGGTLYVRTYDRDYEFSIR